MQRMMLKSKIHRAKVTDANLEYEGSISIDQALMEAGNILPYEKVDVYNISNGARFSTYAIPAENNSGTICINGAAARLCQKDDLIIICAYGVFAEEDLKDYSPILVYVDQENRIKEVKREHQLCQRSFVD